ncbi:MAG: hypothetical protein FWF85_02505 [Clostridiales bacterium]|nr:hypothetical protein [Clostridiales bacterium]
MQIPDKVKIGGQTYSVKVTENISLGQDYLGETNYRQQKIQIRPSAKECQERVFLHELVHAIYFHLGYNDHDEKKTDELAGALHAVLVDNPGIFNNCLESVCDGIYNRYRQSTTGEKGHFPVYVGREGHPDPPGPQGKKGPIGINFCPNCGGKEIEWAEDLDYNWCRACGWSDKDK